MGRRVSQPSGAARLRSVFFWAHLATGVVVGLVVLVMSVTGVLLAYERQVLNWMASRHVVAPPAPGVARLPLDTVLARARNSVGDRTIVSVTVRAEASAPVAVGFEDRQNAFVDPYTAAVVGDDATAKAFFAGVQRWHRWLALGTTPRSPTGKAITGASNLAFLFLILSGFYLWWPRQFSKRAFRAVILFTRGASGKARDWNWHHVLGFWAAPVLILIVASAAFISYAWPGELTQRAFGETPAAEGERGGGRERGGRGEGRGGEGRGGEGRDRGGREREGRRERPGRSGGGGGDASHEEAPVVFAASLDTVAAVGERETPGWQSMQLRLPREPKRPITLAVSTGTGARPDQRAQATFDATTGAVLEWQRYGDGSPYRRFRSWIRPIHTGEAGGLLGQTIAALVCVAAVVLVWTGIALAWRRLRTAMIRRERVPALEKAA